MKKLKLNKQTIALLNNESMQHINGGGNVVTISNCPTHCTDLCPPPDPSHPSVNRVCNY